MSKMQTRWYSKLPPDGDFASACVLVEHKSMDTALRETGEVLADGSEGWPEDVDAIEWGVLVPLQRSQEYDREETPGGEFDYLCKYRLEASPGRLQQVLAALETAGDVDAFELKRIRAIVDEDARKRHGDREGEPSWGVIADCVLAHVSQHRQAREILGVPESFTLDQFVSALVDDACQDTPKTDAVSVAAREGAPPGLTYATTQRVDPCTPIHWKAQQVHGISAEMLKGCKRYAVVGGVDEEHVVGRDVHARAVPLPPGPLRRGVGVPRRQIPPPLRPRHIRLGDVVPAPDRRAFVDRLVALRERLKEPHDFEVVVQVPVLILVTLDVDRPPYDRFPKIKRVEHYVPEGATTPIQAPMPYHIPVWLANDRGWSGTPETITSKVGVIEVIKTDYKQIPFGHGGLKTMRDLKG